MGNTQDIARYGGRKPSASLLSVDSASTQQRTSFTVTPDQDSHSFIIGKSSSLIPIPSNQDILPIKSSILIRKHRRFREHSIQSNDNNNTLSNSTRTSIENAQLLIYGYCRQIEKSQSFQYLIPITIIELLFDFYYISKIIICLTEGNYSNDIN